MLINTVILFIRDMAPIFFLFAILYSQRQDMLQPMIAGISSGFLLAVVLYFNLAAVSEMADGGGLELLKALVLVSAFMAFCWLTLSSKKQLPIALLTCGVTLVNAIHFIIYSAAYWSSQQASALPAVPVFCFTCCWKRQSPGYLNLPYWPYLWRARLRA